MANRAAHISVFSLQLDTRFLHINIDKGLVR